MGKPTKSILGGDERQSLGNGLLEIFACACAYPSQRGFQFGESFLNRREIGRVSRQKQETTATGFDGLFDPTSQVNREIIQDHDLSWTQAGGEDLLHVNLKSGSIGGSIQDERLSHALQGHGSDQRHIRSVVAWNLPDGSLSSGGVGIQWRHGNMGACLIDKHQVLMAQVGRLLAPGRTGCFILFGGSQRLFFRVQPRAILARLMLAGLTWMP